MTEMKKTLISLLTVAVMSISFAACSQSVDLVEESDIQNQSSLSVTVNVPDQVKGSGDALVIAHRILNIWNLNYLKSEESSKKIKSGWYKFYAMTYAPSYYDYSSIKDNADSTMAMINAVVAAKTCDATALPSAYSAVKSELSGTFINPNATKLYADSTEMMEVKTSQSVSMGETYELTKEYTVNGTVKNDSTLSINKVIVTIPDAYSKVRILGDLALDDSKCNCITYADAAVAKGESKEYSASVVSFGLPKSGTATVFICFAGNKYKKVTASYKVSDKTVTIGTITF